MVESVEFGEEWGRRATDEGRDRSLESSAPLFAGAEAEQEAVGGEITGSGRPRRGQAIK